MTEQTAYTKLFIEQLTLLKDNGVISTHAEVAEKLDWHPTALHLVVKGQRNIPHRIYVKFRSLYNADGLQPILKSNPAPVSGQSKQLDSDNYKDKYIALLESQVKHFDHLFNELKEIKELLKNHNC